MSMMILLDYIGVALFAATGALVASRKQLDIIGFIFFAIITGIGGGTLRDLILDVPVFWLGQPLYLLLCTVTAVLVYVTAHLLESRYTWVLWLDAIALAAYGIFGANKGLAVTGSPTVAIVMGVLTSAVGGVIRDVIAGEPSVLLRRDIYISAALIGAVVFVVADRAGLDAWIASGAGFAAAFTLRGGAIAFGWSLPVYRSRPGRDVGE